MLFGFDGGEIQVLVFRDLRQAAFVLIAILGPIAGGAVGLVVLAFFVELQKAREFDHGAGGAEAVPAVFRNDVDTGARQTGAFHLARQRALPD